ncbi:MAG: lamin tail domain-containing protein, partial [Flavobacteriales bacterium]|nr:lamin tail domain-containing protein [Flavobacteriales bacterium]
MKLLNLRLLFLTSLLALSGEAIAQCEPYFGKLVINEFMAANNSTASDEFGEFDDWVEIYNGSEEPINMEGYFLSDNHGNRTKFVFPSVVIEPDDVLIVWCDGQ